MDPADAKSTKMIEPVSLAQCPDDEIAMGELSSRAYFLARSFFTSSSPSAAEMQERTPWTPATVTPPSMKTERTPGATIADWRTMSNPGTGSGSSQIGQVKQVSPQAAAESGAVQGSNGDALHGKIPKMRKVGSSMQGVISTHGNCCAAADPNASATKRARTRLLVAILIPRNLVLPAPGFRTIRNAERN